MIWTEATPGILDRLEGLLDLLDADAVVGDRTVRDQLVQGGEGLRAVEDGVGGQWSWIRSSLSTPRPSRTHPPRLGTPRGCSSPGSAARCGPSWWRRRTLAAALAQEPGDDLLAVAVAVDIGRVDQGHARVGGRVESSEALGVVDLPPAGTDRPRPEADGAHVTAGLAEPAVLHGRAGSGDRLARAPLKGVLGDPRAHHGVVRSRRNGQAAFFRRRWPAASATGTSTGALNDASAA
jgi:hypothetical protein